MTDLDKMAALRTRQESEWHLGYVARIRAAAAVSALREAADAWTQGEWGDAPRRSDRIAERMANARHVGDWLRERAASIEAET